MLYDHEQFTQMEFKTRLRQMKKKRFIRYEVAESHLEEFDLLLDPEIEQKDSYLLTAVPGNGKTTLGKYFIKQNPVDLQRSSDAAYVPILYMKMPAKSTVSGFANNLLEALMQPMPHSTYDERLATAKVLLRELKTRVLILDEFQHLNSGSVDQRTTLRNLVKEFMDDMDISVIAIGTHTALGVVAQCPQLQRRLEPLTLPKWQADDEGRTLIHMLESTLPLGYSSNIAADETLSERIIDKSEGILDWINKLLIKASMKAIRTGKEKIDMDLINSLNWIRPSDRIETARNDMGCTSGELGDK